ncbi:MULTISPECIES: hypothetical protein [unclassified Paenibacillus]|uniref:hypothetical protein n=1 Tax=unclassified Paenibacillus TaxID=185978 RepID=UPI0027838816|nr:MULTISPECIES: hypothetical protein [unclassified Paenibacillus]MDQ0903798.1 putative MFS family arabinose efflux permease [Paenibacillus sp. V4I7]MDQ0917728.1 putative MFS family arabinose efflux permease [Paenibacillus sp. V4I5]
MFGAPSLGRLGDRIGQRKTLVIALSMAALAFIPQAFATSITMLLLIAVPRQFDWSFYWQPSCCSVRFHVRLLCHDGHFTALCWIRLYESQL